MSHPEHEKLNAVKEQAAAVQGFLDWLLDERHGVHGGIHRLEIAVLDEHEGMESLCETREHLMARYFEIDTVRLEQEKQAMLAELRRPQKEVR